LKEQDSELMTLLNEKRSWEIKKKKKVIEQGSRNVE
jgi:hypothetical protein